MGVEPLIKISGVSKNFGPTVALADVSIDINRGEIRGLIGENGSGKSTLSSIVAGSLQPDDGAMLLEGRSYKPETTLDAQRQGIGMVVQELGTVSGISVAENLCLGRSGSFGRFGFVNKKRMIEAARDALERAGLAGFDPSLPIDLLDLQDRKLVELVRAMVNDPALLVLDETTTALSHRGRSLLYALMKRLREERKAVLFVSHDLEELMEVCDVLTVLRDGRWVADVPKSEFDESRIKQLMIGREMTGGYYRTDFDAPQVGEPVLVAENLVTPRGLAGFSTELRKGEILGIGGLSHCGMHQFGKAVFGVERLLAGRVVHVPSGQVIAGPRSAMRCRLGYVSKDRDREALVLSASIKDNIASAGYEKITSGRWFMSRSKEKAYVDRQIQDLSIRCSSREQLVRTLSGGNRQKVVFGKWVGRGSDILVLDCPTRGVDIGVKAAMYQLMYQMKLEGRSLILISEELPELIGMSDRLLILRDGKLRAKFARSRDLTEAQIIEHMI